MNYLAHLSLAFPNKALMAGNYIADLLTRKEESDLHPSLKSGVLMHRWIDNFSNNSAPLTEMNKEFHSMIHKYAPVATDIICDYLLFLSWGNYFDISLTEFSDFNYKTLFQYSDIMPERISAICRKMIQHHWLDQYQTLEGIEQVLKRTNQKTKFDVDLTSILPVFKINQEYFATLFNLFYADCKQQSQHWISLQSGEKM